MKFIRVLKARNWEKVEPIFNKELDELLNKINNKLKSQGVDMYYYAPTKNIHFSDGYYIPLKVKVGDRSTLKKEVSQYCSDLRDIETKNLIFKTPSQTGIGTCVYLKSTYRSPSHRGEIVGIDNWTDEDWMRTGQ